MIFPPNYNQENYKPSLEEVLKVSLKKQNDGSHKFTKDSEKFGRLCIRADVYRGIKLKTDKISFWNASRA